MRVFLIHHAEALTAEQNPLRPLSPNGCAQADRLGTRLRALGVAPVRILHSDKLWTIETAQRIGARLGLEDRVQRAAYPINTGDPVAPFMAEIAAASGDVMMCGHFEFLQRSASRLVCGNESIKVVEFKPGNGATVCIERQGDAWAITFMWRLEHPPG